MNKRSLVKVLETTCSPLSPGSPVRNSSWKTKTRDICMPMSLIRKLVKEYNESHPDNAILIQRGDTKHTLFEALNNRYSSKCGSYDELCWVESSTRLSLDDQALAHKMLSPEAPRHWKSERNAWLSNFDIDDVLSQYNSTHFQFLGVFPIDFQEKNRFNQCIGQDMCSFAMRSLLNKGITKWAIVLNLDRHDEPGRHWVCMYCDMDETSSKYGIYYYDSIADAPCYRVNKFVQRCKEEMKDPKFHYYANRIRHQTSNTECGMFCTCFIVCMLLSNMSYKQIIRENSDIMNDVYMTHLRRKMFRIND